MRYIKVTATVSEPRNPGGYGDERRRVIAKASITPSGGSRDVGGEIADLIGFLCFCDKSLDREEIAAAVVERIGDLPDVYEKAAERAANSAVVTLSRGFDDRFDTLQRSVVRLCERVDELK